MNDDVPVSTFGNETVEPLVAKLVHDVGKYISRTAVNLPVMGITDVLLPLLVTDLYCLDGERRASEVFERLATPIENTIGASSCIVTCRALLKRIDALETRVRGGDMAAASEAAAAAVAVSNELRELRATMRNK